MVDAAVGYGGIVDVGERAATAGEPRSAPPVPRGAGSRVGRGPTRDPVSPGRGSGGASGDHGGRLERARGLLRRMEDRSGDRARALPTPGEDGRLLPVPGPLAPLLPGGGLRRGSTVSVAAGPGAGSLLFVLLAAASAEGSWAGVIGRPGLGAVAAAEAGIRLDRLALVPEPGLDLVAVTAALLDGLDLVVVAVPERPGLRAADRQRLAARARQRGAVLLALGPWPGADVRLHCARVRWEGLAGGAGRLRACRVEVHAHGRGSGAAGRDAELWLPGPDGRVAAVPEPGIPEPVVPGHGAAPDRPAVAVAG